MIDELTECNTMLSVQRKKQQVPPTLASTDAIERYAQISSHPLHKTNRSGILSMDIHPSKDIVATGGIDTNAVLFDRPSSQILCTLIGHSKKTVKILQGSEEGHYNCIHTLKDHTAEVEAVTVHATQKYFVSCDRFQGFRPLPIVGASLIFQQDLALHKFSHVGEASGQEGYTSASFHPDGLILGIGTTEAVVKIWDVKTQTAALDGVNIWHLRKLRNFRMISPYDTDTPTNSDAEPCTCSTQNTLASFRASQ